MKMKITEEVAKILATYTQEEIIRDVTPTDSYSWGHYHLTVIGDGYLPDGMRVHIVEEELTPNPKVLNNALIISAKGYAHIPWSR